MKSSSISTSTPSEVSSIVEEALRKCAEQFLTSLESLPNSTLHPLVPRIEKLLEKAKTEQPAKSSDSMDHITASSSSVSSNTISNESSERNVVSEEEETSSRSTFDLEQQENCSNKETNYTDLSSCQGLVSTIFLSGRSRPVDYFSSSEESLSLSPRSLSSSFKYQKITTVDKMVNTNTNPMMSPRMNLESEKKGIDADSDDCSGEETTTTGATFEMEVKKTKRYASAPGEYTSLEEMPWFSSLDNNGSSGGSTKEKTFEGIGSEKENETKTFSSALDETMSPGRDNEPSHFGNIGSADMSKEQVFEIRMSNTDNLNSKEDTSKRGINLDMEKEESPTMKLSTLNVDFGASSDTMVETPKQPQFFEIEVTNEVFENASLLEVILEFVGSLGFYHKAYRQVVGISKPYPYLKESIREHLQKDQYNSSLTFLVNKAWSGLVVGKEGYLAWQKQEQLKQAERFAIARKAIVDHDPLCPWRYRLCALAISDDSKGFREALECESIMKMVHHFSDHHILPPDDPFRSICYQDPTYSYNDSSCEETSIFDILAYNAVCAGATNVIQVLKEQIDTETQKITTNETTPTTSKSSEMFDVNPEFLEALVVFACDHMCLEEPTKGIEALLERSIVRHPWNNHRVGNNKDGNSLHIAAARGHKKLVDVLLKAGFDPSKEYEEEELDHTTNDYSVSTSRTRTQSVCRLAEDWASIRNHIEVAKLLEIKRKQIRPAIFPSHKRKFYGSLTWFEPDPADPSKQFGLITPDPDQIGISHGKYIFVHSNTIRDASFASNKNNNNSHHLAHLDGGFYPKPHQRLVFGIEFDRKARPVAQYVADARDDSYVELLSQTDGMLAWEQYYVETLTDKELVDLSDYSDYLIDY